jgi:cytidine deaminase
MKIKPVEFYKPKDTEQSVHAHQVMIIWAWSEIGREPIDFMVNYIESSLHHNFLIPKPTWLVDI